MKFKCIKNFQKGWLGFDFRDELKVGSTYTVFVYETRINVYSTETNEWVEVFMMDFKKMFIPAEV